MIKKEAEKSGIKKAVQWIERNALYDRKCGSKYFLLFERELIILRGGAIPPDRELTGFLSGLD